MTKPDIWSHETDEALNAAKADFLNSSLTLKGYLLPQLPDAVVGEIYDEVVHAERAFSPDLSVAGYAAGSAKTADQLLLHDPNTEQPTVLTAEHATDQWRVGKRKEADWGVGGLSVVVGKRNAAMVLATLGRQTGDANYDEVHPIKVELERIITKRQPRGLFSIHGMQGGLFSPHEDSPFDVLVGVGYNPSDKTLQIAEELRSFANDYGLNVGINAPFIKFRKGAPVREEDGKTLQTLSFASSKSATTRAHAQSIAEAEKLTMPAAQVELSKSLRYIPIESAPDQKREAERVYLGFLIISHLVELNTLGADHE